MAKREVLGVSNPVFPYKPPEKRTMQDACVFLDTTHGHLLMQVYDNASPGSDPQQLVRRRKSVRTQACLGNQVASYTCFHKYGGHAAKIIWVTHTMMPAW